MTSTNLSIGIVGIGSPNSWAREAHAPAVSATAGVQLTAVAARSQSRADEVAEEVGAAKAYGSVEDILADPGIDLVTVGAPVPAHDEIIRSAIAAGKCVLTEWPVTPTLEQTRALRKDLADQAGRVFVSFQARYSPATAAALDLLKQDRIGRILNARVLSTTAGWGPHIEASAEYLEDPSSGMELSTIQFAHTFDLVTYLLGWGGQAVRLSAIQYPEVTISEGDDTRTRQRTVADYVGALATVAGGAVANMEVIGARDPSDVPFLFEITGTEGSLRLSGGSPRGFQASKLHLQINDVAVSLDTPEGVADSAVNVAGVYAALRDHLNGNGPTPPTLADATDLAERLSLF